MLVNKKRKIFFVFSVLGFMVTGLVILLYITQPLVFKQVDLKIYDYFLTKLADNNPNPTPVILDIDEKSLKQYGQWPWSRYRLGLIVDKLLKAGTLVVAFDIMLAEPDRTSLSYIQKNIKNELGLDLNLSEISETLLDNDLLLAEMLKNTPVVLGAYMRFGQPKDFSVEYAKKIASQASKVVEFSKPEAISALTYLTESNDIILPIDTLLGVTKIGFFNIALQDDGLIRTVPLLFKLNDKIYVSLALQAIAVARKVKNIRLNTGSGGIESIGIGKHSVIVSPQGTMNVPFRGGAKTFPYISVADLLQDKFPKDQFKDKIVFVGTSAPGLLDLRATPLDSYYPGVEVHANVVDAILSGRYIITPAWTPGLQFILLCLTGIFCTLFFVKVRSAYSIGLILFLGSTFFFSSAYLFSSGFFVSPLWGILLLICLAITIIILRFWLEELDKKRIRQVFSKYVSPEIVSRIVERGESSLKGEQRELTLMFTDLRGFTSMSEKLLPEQVVSLLNKYFTPMTALVRNNSGTLDKFIGDALMAFWNAPLDVENHPKKAVETALAMLNKLTELNVEMEKEFGICLNMGVGIHTGLAYVGNMGSLDLTNYTAIGDVVNIASRLESLCSIYGFKIVLSEETADKVDLFLQKLTVLRVKGRKEPITVYAVLSEKEASERKDELGFYVQALSDYELALKNHDLALLERAMSTFETLSTLCPERYLYSEYADYCSKLINNPSRTWEGIWTLNNK